METKFKKTHLHTRQELAILYTTTNIYINYKVGTNIFQPMSKPSNFILCEQRDILVWLWH